MAHYEKVEMTDDVIEMFRTQQRIPLHFYNQDGTILIYSKENATPEEIDRLIRYSEKGIYFDTEDEHLLKKTAKRSIPDGLTDTKLISTRFADTLYSETQYIFDELKRTTISSLHTKRTTSALNNIFSEFQNQDDVMTGLVNIIEKLQDKKGSVQLSITTKRTVVAMAIKTRGVTGATETEKDIQKENITELMMSAMLCDIGTEKMKMPGHRFLKKEEMDYVKNHPLLSYLLIAHEPSIHPNIKRNILCHHRPLRDDLSSNNYPPIKLLLEKLEALRNKYHNEPGHLEIANDIAGQIQLLKNDLPYDENANILAIASAFASLTSDVPWREAYEPAEAVRMIINNSLFSYSQRTLRDFLDHVAISLCDNRKIINEGDFVITNIKDSEGKNFFEAGIISKSDRYQSRPQIDRFASIEPIFQKHPLMHIEGFNLETLKLDPRSAHFDLRKDDSRHIAYLVDKFENEELYKQLARMTGQL